jgi:hypothetical protein
VAERSSSGFAKKYGAISNSLRALARKRKSSNANQIR